MDENRQKAATKDPRSTSQIIAALLSPANKDKTDTGLLALHARATRTEFEAGAQLCKGKTVKQRVLGADILAQLGWTEHLFQQEAVDLLIPLLSDNEPEVASAAGIALGHRNDKRAIAPALALCQHENADVRFGVVMALSRHDDEKAIAGLIVLGRDADRNVRNWATFALAQLTDMDTPELRQSLMLRLTDKDAEIRGEALIGLARRGDLRVLEALEKELAGEFHGAWAIEAAGHLKLPRLRLWLKKLKSRLSTDDLAAFGDEIDQAMAACRKNK